MAGGVAITTRNTITITTMMGADTTPVDTMPADTMPADTMPGVLITVRTPSVVVILMAVHLESGNAGELKTFFFSAGIGFNC
jgi:hypothetical protein